MIRQLLCRWGPTGHDYIFGLGSRFNEEEVLKITFCTKCGANHISVHPTLRIENGY